MLEVRSLGADATSLHADLERLQRALDLGNQDVAGMKVLRCAEIMEKTQAESTQGCIRLEERQNTAMRTDDRNHPQS